jgi:alpha-tubulin suppressor-like RCC1 family protein
MTLSIAVQIQKSIAQVISAGDHFSAFLCNDGSVNACGDNLYGQLGNGSIIKRDTIAVQVSGLTGIIAVSAGSSHTLYLRNDGTVWSSGYNSAGQLGNGTMTNSLVPIQVTGLTGITAISAGSYHSLFLKNDSSVWVCGVNNYGELGDGTTNQQLTPVKLSGLSGIMDISGGQNFSLFLKNNGTVFACGNNWYGQLGNGAADFNLHSTPALVSGLSGVKAISAGKDFSLFLLHDGTVMACGKNSWGALGDGTTSYQTIPVQAIGLSDIVALNGGGSHSLFLKNDGSVWACGGNYSGQFGDGTTTPQNIAMQINGLNGIKAIAAGSEHSLFLQSDGSVWATGYNANGELGDGTTVNKDISSSVLNLCNVATSLDENPEALKISISPNPFSGIFEVKSNMPEPLLISVYNIIGENILTLASDIIQTKIDLMDQPKGVYLISIQNKSGYKFNGKVINQ